MLTMQTIAIRTLAFPDFPILRRYIRETWGSLDIQEELNMRVSYNKDFFSAMHFCICFLIAGNLSNWSPLTQGTVH